MSFDIARLAATDTADIPLTSPATGEPLHAEDGTALAVRVYGPGSKVYAAAQADRAQRMLDRMARKGRNHRMSPEEQQAEMARFLAAVTERFVGFTYRGDAAAIEAAYADPAMGWLSEQVSKGVGDWANFCSGSATS